jgi:hypothetical protein
VTFFCKKRLFSFSFDIRSANLSSKLRIVKVSVEASGGGRRTSRRMRSTDLRVASSRCAQLPVGCSIPPRSCCSLLISKGQQGCGSHEEGRTRGGGNLLQDIDLPLLLSDESGVFEDDILEQDSREASRR